MHFLSFLEIEVASSGLKGSSCLESYVSVSGDSYIFPINIDVVG
ncbi:hypothetical protein CDS [Salmonella enterica subsp. enterica serovar Derby]|nr:hypothetical protein CDS [Salmonella enterica subsp. enterica serovar Derby]